jgi:hypothetical protein
MAKIRNRTHADDGASVIDWARTEDPRVRRDPGGNKAPNATRLGGGS